jgi:hypothetical protein
VAKLMLAAANILQRNDVYQSGTMVSAARSNELLEVLSVFI